MELLYQVACKMIRQDKKRGKACMGEDHHAMIETSWKSVCIVPPLVGIQFHGEVVTPKGVTEIEYVVKESDVDADDSDVHVEWFRHDPESN